MSKEEEQAKKYALIEGNLLEYPIFSMERVRADKTIEEYVWKNKDAAGRVVVEQKLRVECARGVPNFHDMNVFNGIMRIYVKKSGLYKKNEIHFTIYELLREMNLPTHHGGVVKETRESLKRMGNTTLNYENAFYQEKERITKIVHLIAQVEIYEKQKGNRLINMIKVVLDDELVSSIERKYFNLIDFDIYKSLPSGVPRRLYEYLEKKKYRKDQFEIDIKKLAGRIPLKTKKVSQLKGLLEKANKELKRKEIIDKWEFRKSHIIYYFKKSERFKQVERDLFYLETMVRTFYESIGQTKISGELLNEGMAVLQGLIDEGYTREEVEYTLGWTVDNIKGIHSIRILPKVIGQALGDKESKALVEQRVDVERQERLKEEQKLAAEKKRDEELEDVFQGLPEDEREEIEAEARKRLTARGVKPEFIRETVLRVERDKILEERELV